jgi:hypothetical protein
VDRDAIERAERRLAALRSESDDASLAAIVERAGRQLASFAEATAELEAILPDRVSSALHESLRSEVLPVARHLAEVRGLSAQTIRRLERLHADVVAERAARVEDLALMVDLVTTGWRSLERRLDRLERILDRLERSLEEQAPTRRPVVRLEDRRQGSP